MKKKALALFLAGAMVMGLTACGSQAPAADSSAPAADAAAPAATEAAPAADAAASADGLNMVFSWWGNQTRNERTQASLDLYSEQNPGITFDAQPSEWADYWTKLSTAAAGNALPDLAQMDYSYLAQYVSSDLLVDLTPYVEDGSLDVSGISQSIIDSGSIDGKLYAVAAGVNAPSLLYNKTLMDELGITVKDNMTLDEFYAVAREVYEKKGIKTDMPYQSSNNFLPYLTRAEGTVRLFNEDSLNVADASAFNTYFSVYETGAKEGWIVGADVHAELTSNSVEQSPLVYFSSEDTQSWCGFFWSNQMTAMVAAAEPLGIEIGITTWPSTNPKASNFLKPSQFFSVTRDAQDPATAVKVVDFLTNSVEANEILLGERGVPASSVVAEAILPKQDETAKIVTDYINNVVTPNSSTISPAIPDGATEVYSEIDLLVDEVLYGEMTAQEASEAAFAKGNEIMGRK